MKNYTFYNKNSSAIMTLSADSYEDALESLIEEVAYPSLWRCDDEEGED